MEAGESTYIYQNSLCAKQAIPHNAFFRNPAPSPPPRQLPGRRPTGPLVNEPGGPDGRFLRYNHVTFLPRYAMRKLLLVALSLLFATAGLAQGKPAPADNQKPYAIEYYYKVRWGHQEEFLNLFKKNHYPLLRRQVEMGRIVELKMETPTYHMPEEERWDYRVTIVFKSAHAAVMPFDEEALKSTLFPDQERYQKEEQRRFEILIAHWDLPIKEVALEAK